MNITFGTLFFLTVNVWRSVTLAPCFMIIMQMAVFLENHDFIYIKKRPDHAFADRNNRAWQDLAWMTEIEAKMLTTFSGSIWTQSSCNEQRGQGGKGADGVAAVDHGQVPIPAASHQPCVQAEYQSFCPPPQ